MKKFLFVLIGVFVVIGAFAAGENVPTSKSYVDSKMGDKQDIIPANDGAARVLTNTGTAGEYGTKGIYDATGEYATQTQNLVDAATMNAGVQNAIDSEFQCIEWLDPNDHSSECLLLQIGNQNLFRPEMITNTARLINNGDGSFTCTAEPTNSVVGTGKKLSELAPDLVAGNEYIFTFETTAGSKYIQLRSLVEIPNARHAGVYWYYRWVSGTKLKMTQELLNSEFTFQINTNSTRVVSNIDIHLVPIYLPTGE